MTVKTRDFITIIVVFTVFLVALCAVVNIVGGMIDRGATL